MSELKTKPTTDSIQDYLDAIENETQRKDCRVLFDLMKKVTNQPPEVWGHGTIGFGRFAYESKSGRKGEWYKVGFAARKANISIHIMLGFDKTPELMERLGKYKTGKGCLYVKTLDDIDLKALEELIEKGYTDFTGFQ